MSLSYIDLIVKLVASFLISACVSALGFGFQGLGTGPEGGGGHYDVTYSAPGAMWTSTGPFGTATGPYTITTTSVNASAVTGGVAANLEDMFATLGTAQASGTVRARYVWNTDGDSIKNPVPKCVIVRETVSASWSGTSGSCDNSIGDFETWTGPNSGVSIGSRYSIHVEDASDFTVSCSPSANVLAAEGSLILAGSIGISYTTTVYIPKLSLGGTIGSGDNKSMLVSQGLSASVSLGGEFGEANYTWSLNGGGPFKDYVPTTAKATKTDFILPPSNQASLKAYMSKVDNVKVSCNVSVPSVDLSFLLEDKVTVKAPTFSSFNQNIGKFKLIPNASSPTFFKLTGATHPAIGGQFMAGIVLDFWVTTPPEYIDGDVGNYTIAQTIKNSSAVDSDPVYPTDANFGVDQRFPYQGYNWMPATTRPILSQFPGSGYWADSPGIWSQNAANLIYDGDLNLYVFYAGPGDSKPVAIRKLSWLAKGTATSGIPWAWADTGSKISGGWVVNNDFPIWVRAITNIGSTGGGN
jgi:hypothetical protein